jgi:hypothetical protein
MRAYQIDEKYVPFALPKVELDVVEVTFGPEECVPFELLNVELDAMEVTFGP